METAELAINKLIILSILNRIQGITLGQLTELSLETLYMDYFDFATAFEELCRDHMAQESVRKSETVLDSVGRPVTRCDLTPQGRAVFNTLENRIPLPIRSYLAQACSGWQKDIRLRNTLSASCEPDANGFYQVRLKQNDGLKDLIDLYLTIPDKNMGQMICERWKRNPQTVYLGLLSLLTGEPSLIPETSSSYDNLVFKEPAETNEDPSELPADPQQQSLFD
ncbi:MAG: DUF4364 family protein [Clostridiaceae bacterium]|nr:DUF4364 family protein [Clostridiaceae bacterium]